MSLYRQLVWREFFFTLASRNPQMDRMIDNPLSLNIAWEKNDRALDAWKNVSAGTDYNIVLQYFTVNRHVEEPS